LLAGNRWHGKNRPRPWGHDQRPSGKGAILPAPDNSSAQPPRCSCARVALFLLAWPLLLIWCSYMGWDALKAWQGDGAALDAYKDRIRGWRPFRLPVRVNGGSKQKIN
jgi:hypothetical protein